MRRVNIKRDMFGTGQMTLLTHNSTTCALQPKSLSKVFSVAYAWRTPVRLPEQGVH